MVRGINHVGVSTRNLRRLVAFYVDHFDAEVLGEFSWDESCTELIDRLGIGAVSGRLMLLGFAGTKLEIFEFAVRDAAETQPPRSAAMPGFSHICFEVDDCEAEFRRLQNAGMRFHGPPLVMPSGGIFTYGRDPDGNIVELLQPPIT